MMHQLYHLGGQQLETIGLEIYSLKRNEVDLQATLTRKDMNLFYLTPYVCTEGIFDSRPLEWSAVQQNIFEKTVIKVGSSHLQAYFGTFFVQIGQLFEAP